MISISPTIFGSLGIAMPLVLMSTIGSVVLLKLTVWQIPGLVKEKTKKIIIETPIFSNNVYLYM